MKWDDYFRETTLHGFKYVASDWPGSVRIVWAAVIAVDLCVSWFIVSDLFAADVRNPVITTIGSVSADKVRALLNKRSGKSWNYWILLGELLRVCDRLSEWYLWVENFIFEIVQN